MVETLPWILQRSYIAQVALEVRSYLLHLSLVLYRGNWGWARRCNVAVELRLGIIMRRCSVILLEIVMDMLLYVCLHTLKVEWLKHITYLDHIFL